MRKQNVNITLMEQIESQKRLNVKWIHRQLLLFLTRQQDFNFNSCIKFLQINREEVGCFTLYRTMKTE